MNRSPITIFILGIFFFGFACFVTYTSSQSYRLAKDSEHWPQTMGKLLKNYVVTHEHVRCRTQYEPVILYSYTVTGKHYFASRIRFPGIGFDRYSEANNFLSRYPEGASTLVYYNPENPSISCLEMSYLNDDPAATRGYVTASGVMSFILFFNSILFLCLGAFMLKKQSQNS